MSFSYCDHKKPNSQGGYCETFHRFRGNQESIHFFMMCRECAIERHGIKWVRAEDKEKKKRRWIMEHYDTNGKFHKEGIK